MSRSWKKSIVQLWLNSNLLHVKLQIWDTAGQERFRSFSKSYFGTLLVQFLFFITSENLFDKLENWLQDLHQLCNPNAYTILVGKKLISKRKEKLENTTLNSETSAFSGQNVLESFTRLASEITNLIGAGQT